MTPVKRIFPTHSRFSPVALALIGASLLCSCREPRAHRDVGRPVSKIEIKLLVPADKVVWATASLKLAQRSATKFEVFFFDTPDGDLAAHDLILRARQPAGGPVDTIAKLRTANNAAELSDSETSLKPEDDWTNDQEPVHSRSVDHEPLPEGLLQRVAAGRTPVAALFNDQQRGLVSARLKNFYWENLNCYGPTQAEVWEGQIRLKGFPKPVTVERWHLERNGRTLDLLEVSAKAKAETEAYAKFLAGQFFEAARVAGLGQPTGQTKTRLVLDFFKPGL